VCTLTLGGKQKGRQGALEWGKRRRITNKGLFTKGGDIVHSGGKSAERTERRRSVVKLTNSSVCGLLGGSESRGL